MPRHKFTLSLLPEGFSVGVPYSGETTIRDLLRKGKFDYFSDGQFDYSAVKNISDLNHSDEFYHIDDTHFPQGVPGSQLYKAGTHTFDLRICVLEGEGCHSDLAVIRELEEKKLRAVNAAELLAFAISHPEDAARGATALGQIDRYTSHPMGMEIGTIWWSYSLAIQRGRNEPLRVCRRLVATKQGAEKEVRQPFPVGARFAVAHTGRY